MTVNSVLIAEMLEAGKICERQDLDDFHIGQIVVALVSQMWYKDGKAVNHTLAK